MCLRCDGYSEEQVMLAIDLTVRTHGWQLTQVEDERPFSYTVGLLQTFGHPELVVVDMKLDSAADLIGFLVRMLESNGRIDHEQLGTYGTELVTVHPNHLNGEWFGTWMRYYQSAPPPDGFMQVIPPPNWYCRCHQHSIRRLDRPDGRPLRIV